MNQLLRVLFVGTVLFGIGFAHAQQANELAAGPKQVRRFTVTFSGADADKVQRVLATIIRTDAQPQPDQAGFKTSADSGWVIKQPSDKSFVAEIRIPDDIMDGLYRVQIDITATMGSSEYVNGKDFQVPEIHVRNSSTFTPPKIEVKESR